MHVKKIHISEAIMLMLFILLFIFIRSLNFTEHLNFSADQALFSLKSYQLWQDKSLELIGPAISFTINGRQIFQGSIIYYFQLLFLIPANFSPVLASYLFMLFASLSLIPLYYSTKSLINKNAAMFLLITYTLFPFYINYTRFLWNPNFQFILIPYLIYLISLYKKHKDNKILFIIGVFEGFLLMFHYQFLLILLGTMLYFFIGRTKNFKKALVVISGTLIGFFPLILFELRNNFYNLRTVIYFFNNRTMSPFGKNDLAHHYILSISFLGIIISVYFLREKIKRNVNTIFFLCLLTYALSLYAPQPETAFGAPAKWNYIKEETVFNVIRSENVSGFNIVNQIYDTKAAVQKYLFIANGSEEDFEDYHNNKYLFIISQKEEPLDDPAYEVSTFRPSLLIKTWEIDDNFTLYLFERE